MKKIKTYGGIDISHFIKSCMENLFSKELTTHLSFTGKKFKKTMCPKIGLNKLILFQAVCGMY